MPRKAHTWPYQQVSAFDFNKTLTHNTKKHKVSKKLKILSDLTINDANVTSPLALKKPILG